MDDDKPSYDELEQRVIDLARENQRLFNEVRQLSKPHSFAGAIAHDMTNILCGLLGNIQLAMNKLGESNPAYKYLESVQEAANNMGKSTAELLNSAHPRAFRRNEDCLLTDILEDSLKLLERDVYHGHGVDISTEYGKDLPHFKGNKTELSQVYLNLMINGMESTPKGGSLKIKAQEFEGKPSDKLEQGKYVLVEIEDSGKGIPEDHITKVFEPFFTTKDSKGTGLGLSIAYDIIKNHGGDIIVESEVDKGSKFSVYIPIEKELCTKNCYLRSNL